MAAALKARSQTCANPSSQTNRLCAVVVASRPERGGIGHGTHRAEDDGCLFPRAVTALTAAADPRLDCPGLSGSRRKHKTVWPPASKPEPSRWLYSGKRRKPGGERQERTAPIVLPRGCLARRVRRWLLLFESGRRDRRGQLSDGERRMARGERRQQTWHSCRPPWLPQTKTLVLRRPWRKEIVYEYEYEVCTPAAAPTNWTRCRTRCLINLISRSQGERSLHRSAG